jgi:hypothetical protein
MPQNGTVSQQRNYRVLDVQAAKEIALVWLERIQLEHAISFGLPEVDDRYHVWRVPPFRSSWPSGSSATTLSRAMWCSIPSPELEQSAKPPADSGGASC